jgi:lipoprotein LprG
MKRTISLFLALLILAALAVVGCAKSTPSQTLPPSPTTLTAAEILTKSSDNLQAAKSFHFALDQIGGGTPITLGIEMTKMSGDIVKPDKMKATITGTFMNSALEVQIISAGGKTYMTNPLSGQWEVPPAQFQILSVFNPDSGIAAIMKGMSSPTMLPDETVAGVACYHLKGSILSETLSPITGSSAPGTTISTEVWIGKEDFLVRTIKLEGKITDTENDGIVRKLTLSNYNQPVDIQPPQTAGGTGT